MVRSFLQRASGRKDSGTTEYETQSPHGGYNA